MTNSTTARGYGTEHQAKRAEWQPLVDAGHVNCHADLCLMLDRWIAPGTPWDLGHNPDRTIWTGPEHRRCNRSEGARRGNQTRGTTRASRRWVL